MNAASVLPVIVLRRSQMVELGPIDAVVAMLNPPAPVTRLLSRIIVEPVIAAEESIEKASPVVAVEEKVLSRKVTSEFVTAVVNWKGPAVLTPIGMLLMNERRVFVIEPPNAKAVFGTLRVMRIVASSAT